MLKAMSLRGALSTMPAEDVLEWAARKKLSGPITFDRRELVRVDETTVGGDEHLLDLGVSPGVYYLTVSNKNSSANNPTQEYKLVTKLEPSSGRERQPNFSALTAQPIEAGGLVRDGGEEAGGQLRVRRGSARRDARPHQFCEDGDDGSTARLDPLAQNGRRPLRRHQHQPPGHRVGGDRLQIAAERVHERLPRVLPGGREHPPQLQERS